jgi:hypothetical protein
MALPAGAYFLVQWPAVQTYLAGHIARQVSANLNATFKVGKVDVAFFNRVILRDILIEDQQGDTLLIAERLIATIQYFSRSKKDIHFNQVNLQNARFRLQSDADSLLNARFIIDALSSDDPEKKRWNFSINGMKLENARFSYQRYNSKDMEYGINFHDLEIWDLNLLANKIHTTADSVHFNIKYLNFRENSGFILNHYASQNSISKTGMKIENLHIISPRSRLALEHFHMSYDGFKAFKDFTGGVTLNGLFNSSVINSGDIGYFAPSLKEVDLEFMMAGEVTGRINNLKGNNISLSSLHETSLHADFNMVGLPDFRETFIFLDLHEFISSADEIMEIAGPLSGNREIAAQLPLDLSMLGGLRYKGKFTGFIDDFVAFGELNTGLGTLISDLSLQPDSDNKLNFSGKLKALDFDAGTLTGSDQIGRITFNAGLNGQIAPHKGVNANMEGTIDSVFVFDYTYSNIRLEGHLADRKYEGSANIEDPNISLSFLGSIDLSHEIPVFDFSADVARARLHDLKFTGGDSTLILSFVSKANFRGDNIDNLNGEIELINAVFERDDHIFKIDHATLEATGAGNHRQIVFHSNLAEARVEGNYEFATITRSFGRLISNYLPSYAESYSAYPEVSGNSFKFSVHLKESSGFTEFFIPELSLATGTLIEGAYDPSTHNSRIDGHTGELRFNNQRYTNMVLAARSTDSLIRIISSAERLFIGNRFQLENIELISGIKNDSISFETRWDNRDIKRNKGDFFASVSFTDHPVKGNPLVNIAISPSRVIIADSVWNIESSRIMLDTTAWQVDNFVFGRNDQHIKVHGKLSEDRYDSIHLEFQNIDLQNMELLSMPGKFHIEGKISGYASLSDLYKNPVFKTDLVIREMLLNNQYFGDMTVLSQWNNKDRSIFLHTYSDRGEDRIINIQGNYLPENKLLDFDVSFNKISLLTFDGYLDEVFGNPRGLASGNLKLKGTMSEPLFNGNILLEKASFMVDYLKTRYNFTHDVAITNNNIYFKDVMIYDSQHNLCRTSGSLTNKYFRDFNLNIYLYPEKFMALNTTERDNELFYGRVYTTGLVHITGPANKLTMNISARTDRNTRFFIPLQRGGEISDLYFLNFTSGTLHSDENTVHDQDPRNYEVNLAGIQLNFDLDVTPDADVQIIFDSKIGDIIRGRGSGSFKMEINTTGQFNMFGEYTIEQGDYLFTLQNVINKRFDIERGGRIFWNGDPFDANIDIRAVYRLRASIGTLMAPYTNGTDERYARRIPVECQIVMRDKLMTPDISFSIEVPAADPEIRQRVQGILNTEEKRNKQFLSLLVINNFLPDQDMIGPGRGSSFGMSATEASKTTVSEFFSNQLSNWLSQLSRDVDFGFNWRPGDEMTSDEVEFALSTQVLNDRVSINGHVDVGGRYTNTSNIVGDFDVDIKLNRSGKLRLKAFTRANDNLIRPHLSPYTQGVGLFYREDFDSFDELLYRYWHKIFPASKEKEDNVLTQKSGYTSGN